MHSWLKAPPNTLAKMIQNTLMQHLMNLGFVGLTINLFQMFFTIRGILKENQEKKLMLFGILIPILINSFTEFGIFGESNYGILFYQLVIFSIAYYHNPKLAKEEKLLLKRKRPGFVMG
jgi:exopolysaccharide production protein ExoQ